MQDATSDAGHKPVTRPDAPVIASSHGYDEPTLGEALQRLPASGPEFRGFLSNHGPMAVEAMVRNGQARRVHRWLDTYENRLEGVPGARTRITDANWQEALGGPGRVTDWTAYFTDLVAERPWREVLAEWWPRLLPGIAGAATHPVIRVGHAVRSLLAEGADAPRIAELTHAPGYWAAPGIMLVHAATAPNAVLRTLPALPRELWASSFAVAWAATSAITAIYAADTARPAPDASSLTPEEVFERAVANGNEHAIKFADTALDVAAASEDGDTRALSAALNAVRLIDE